MSNVFNIVLKYISQILKNVLSIPYLHSNNKMSITSFGIITGLFVYLSTDTSDIIRYNPNSDTIKLAVTFSIWLNTTGITSPICASFLMGWYGISLLDNYPLYFKSNSITQ